MAWRQSPGGSEQHLTRAAAAARTRTQRPGKHLAVHASELVVKPDFQILRRYRRPLLLRLEHTHRPTLEDYVHRATRLGSSRSLNLRIGISTCPFSELHLQHINPSASPNELNTTLTPHSMIHGDACFAYFNKIWGIPPSQRLRMFSLLLASINIHYNVSLSELLNSFHLQLPELASATARTFPTHQPVSARRPASVIFARATSIILPSATMRSGVRTQAPRSPDQPKRQSIAASDLPCSSSRSERLPGLGA